MITSTSMLMSTYIRTTIKLREDIYQRLKKEVGTRRLSEKINELLEAKLSKKEKSLFGTMPRVDLEDFREHKDRL